ncbi:MATE family efflux transporter [Denitrobacterium detoxificans]|uniref:Putative efflux protein, MATE family n=1 Tax=Denitrobacterium detoxificans TaxID=79604 RepID=A0A1H8TR57_9ACTN|nr:MATE family efflux transporter [Denitrobacterium detoxificans]SEO93316.1 putative efflux protein, MATE family [Denitrobacterium detoxificans]
MAQRRDRSIDMLNGPLLGKILLFALPLIITSCLQQLFNSVDSAIAGQFVSNEALAAIGATAPIVNLVVNVFVGLSVGANVAVAVRIANGSEAEIKQAVHTSMTVSIVCGLALIAVGLGATGPLLNAIATPESVMGPAAQYLGIYFIGTPFIMLYNFGSAVLRGKGDTRSPLYALAIACAVNGLLDLLFTTVVPLGVTGVALATVIAYASAAAIVLAAMMRDKGVTHLNLRQLRIARGPLSTLLKIGVPAGIQGAVFAISNLVIQAAINGFGSEAMAGSTASLNMESYSYFAVSAFAQTAVTFMGQNFATKQYGRCRRIFAICMGGSIVFTGIMGVLFAVFMQPLEALFTADALAMAFASIRMWRVAVIEFIPAFYEVPAGAMRGMGSSLMPAIITVIGTCALRLAWVGTVFAADPTFETLMNVYPISWLATGIAMMGAYFIFTYRVQKGIVAQRAERKQAKRAAKVTRIESGQKTGYRAIASKLSSHLHLSHTRKAA